MPGSAVPTRLQHVVLLKFATDLDEDEDAELRAIVAGWHGVIDELLVYRFGSDLTGARTRGYQYLLLTEVRDTDALAAYVAHPAHQVLVRWLDARDCQRLAFDYYLDEAMKVTG